MKNRAGHRAARRAQRVAETVLLTAALAAGAQAAPLDEAINSFSRKLSDAATNNGDPTARDPGNQVPFAESFKKRGNSTPQADLQDYTRHQVPVGTQVRIGAIHLERILPQPTLSAQPVEACVNIARQAKGTQGSGVIIVKGYRSSHEDPMVMRKHSNLNGELKTQPPFQAFWAQVQHTPVNLMQGGAQASNGEGCRGWLRIDSLDTYRIGTGAYRSSLLYAWQDYTIGTAPAPEDGVQPDERRTPGQQAVVSQKGYLQREVRAGTYVCQLLPGEEVMIMEKVPAKDMYKVRVVKASKCNGVDFGYLPGRLIQ